MYTHLDRHLREWREYDVDNIFVSTVSLGRDLEHLHTNHQDFNAIRPQTLDFALPFFQFLTDARVKQSMNENRRNFWQRLADAYCLKDSKQAVRKLSKETALTGESLNREWTGVEESLLIEWREQGKSFVEIGAALGRTDLVVACKYLELVPLPESESDCGVHQHCWEFNLKQKVTVMCAICTYSHGVHHIVGCGMHNGILDVSWSLCEVSGCSQEQDCARCDDEMSQPATWHG